MAENSALNLGEVQKRFSNALTIIEELRTKLVGIVEAEQSSATASEHMASASERLGVLSSELSELVAALKSAVTSFDHNAAEVGKALATTSTTSLEAKLSDFQDSVETQFSTWGGLIDQVGRDLIEIKERVQREASDARDRVTALENQLSRIPEKYRNKFLR
jgi:DNA repair ATPase RecN